MNATKLSVNLSPATIDWVRETAGDNAEIFEAQNGDDLQALLNKHDNKPFAVLVPSRTESKWWAELVGSTPKNIAFLQGRPKGSSVGLALIIYNGIEKMGEIEDATVLVPKLLEMGYTGKSLADAIDVSPMAISRAMSRRNHYYDGRLDLNVRLNNLYKQKSK